MSSCIRKEDVLEYLSGNMPADKVNRIKVHLSECGKCRRFIEQEDQKREKTSGLFDKTRVDPLRTESLLPQSEQNFQTSHSQILESLTDGYTILEGLSRGGQAVVYKAVQKSTRRTVVVKVLPQESHASKRARYRFEHEIEMIARLQHPNIVTVFDSGITEGKYFYAMEYIEGLPLDDYIKKHGLSQKEIMVLFGQITSASAYAHRNGIIHRDLKPANIMIDQKGQPHILDFGLAKVVDSMQSSFEGSIMTSMEGELLGTLAFMSPEQTAGKTSMIDIRTDVYSIGVMLYHALTHVFPYPIHGALLEVLKNIQEIEPEKPSKIIDNINSDIEAITLKALSKEPERRYQSANELYEDIQSFLEDRPVSVKADNSLYVLRKLVKKHRRTSLIVVLLGVIVLGFSISSLYLYTNERTAVKGLEAARDELSLEMQKLVQYGTNRVFIDFLLAWQEGHIRRTVAFITDAKQRHAVEFLNENNVAADRISDYLDKTPKENIWFAYFVVAELYYKESDFSSAKEYYLKSSESFLSLPDKLQSTNDGFFRFIKSRLYEMTSESLPLVNTNE